MRNDYEQLQEDAILALLRLKRRSQHDGELTIQITELQRRLEHDLGVYGVQLDPAYVVPDDYEPEPDSAPSNTDSRPSAADAMNEAGSPYTKSDPRDNR